MRAMWTGAVSFGLVSVPVKLYAATENHDIKFHQVHAADGGRIRYKRVCTVCGEEVDYADIVKGYETEDGELITLDESDLESLPTAGGNREIDVVEFVPADQVDPLLLERSYYLEPENRAVKPYVLLREALRQTDRMALVKVALRQRESLAVLRVRGSVIVLQTMLWTDEVRAPDFEILDTEVELRTQETAMAASLIDSLSADFDATRFADEYRDAMVALIDRKRSTGDSRPAPPPAAAGGDGADSMSDLLTALQRSVEAAQAASGRGSTPAGSRESTGSRESAGSPGSAATDGTAGSASVPSQRTGSPEDGGSTKKKPAAKRSRRTA
ncbi:MAG TPA: Ku protein [Pseudonocardia sp.]|jgi:DNA end-binding protein Ku